MATQTKNTRGLTDLQTILDYPTTNASDNLGLQVIYSTLNTPTETPVDTTSNSETVANTSKIAAIVTSANLINPLEVNFVSEEITTTAETQAAEVVNTTESSQAPITDEEVFPIVVDPITDPLISIDPIEWVGSDEACIDAGTDPNTTEITDAVVDESGNPDVSIEPNVDPIFWLNPIDPIISIDLIEISIRQFEPLPEGRPSLLTNAMYPPVTIYFSTFDITAGSNVSFSVPKSSITLMDTNAHSHIELIGSDSTLIIGGITI
jgi:hypothetical protein